MRAAANDGLAPECRRGGSPTHTCCPSLRYRVLQALIDGPRSVTGIHRQTVNFRQLALTPLSIKIGRNAREKSIKKALEKADTLSKWEATAWAQKRAARKARSSESDFQRFENMLKRTKVRARALAVVVANRF